MYQYRQALKEIEEYNKDPLSWPDGVKRKLHIIFANGDAPEKADTMGHVRHNCFFACMYCYERGDRIGKLLRFLRPVHEEPVAKLRTEAERLRDAALALQEAEKRI